MSSGVLLLWSKHKVVEEKKEARSMFWKKIIEKERFSNGHKENIPPRGNNMTQAIKLCVI